MRRRTFNRAMLAAALSTLSLNSLRLNAGKIETVKVGILHSLSGTMAISEQMLKDAALMTIGFINLEGGILGKYLDPVVMDPASNWNAFASKTRSLLLDHQVAAIFGCWTSVSRKQVLPVVEQHNGLLFYPVQYEGQEQSPNIFYTGATPNQQALPAVRHFLQDRSYRRFVLLGTDYVYPRTTNRILRAFLNQNGIGDRAIFEHYTPFSFRAYRPILENIRAFAGGEKTLIVSTINGDSNLDFYRHCFELGVDPEQMPVVAFSVGEAELQQIKPAHVAGHYAAWNYFMSVQHPRNRDFIDDWRLFLKDRYNLAQQQVVTSDPMEATHIGIQLWKQAVEQADSFEVDKVRAALAGQAFDAPSGYRVMMDQQNHHLHKPAMLGRALPDGQFEVIWSSDGLVAPEPWSPFIAAGRGA